MDQPTTPLTKQEVDQLQPQDVHRVLRRKMLVDGFDFVFDKEGSKGPYIRDAITGKEYLDFFSFFASWPIAHNHPKMAEPAFLESISKVSLQNPSNSDVYTVEMAQFVATFERVAMPPEFKHLFLVAGGSLAVENALKTAFDWKVRLNLSRGRGEKGSKAIHLKDAFHGRSGYSLSLTNTDPRKYKYFPLFNWPRVENPKAIFPLEGANLWATIEAEKRACVMIKEILEHDADNIAAIILEPIQGEGGDNHFRPEFWKQLRKFADDYDVLLIADEVQSGMGLTGRMWAYQHLGTAPDIVCFGKKAQVCGIMATSRIDNIPDNVFHVPSRINSTWGGNLVDMVRSRKFLEIIEEEDLIRNAAEVGTYLLDSLKQLSQKFPSCLANVRGRGLMCAFDTQDPDRCTKLKALAYEKNLLIISCGSRSIRLRPLLTSTKQDIDNMIAILTDCFEVMSKDNWQSGYCF